MPKLADIQTGDLLCWKRDRRSRTSDFLIRMIKILTGADYGHVAVAVRLNDTVFVYEASLPMVKLSLCRPEEEIWHIPMGLTSHPTVMSYFYNLLGLDYGIMDDVRALFGFVSARDDKYQCAELTREFYAKNGMLLDCNDIPDDVVKAIIKITGREPELLSY